jgi:hypothetical protein
VVGQIVYCEPQFQLINEIQEESPVFKFIEISSAREVFHIEIGKYDGGKNLSGQMKIFMYLKCRLAELCKEKS